MGKIYLEGADNTRDLGGLKTTEGAVIKDKQLIRSNRLSRITQKDKILLETEYHLQKILDLRTPMEVEQEPDLEVAGAVYENIPFFYGKHGGSQPGAGNKKTDVTYGRISRDVRYL